MRLAIVGGGATAVVLMDALSRGEIGEPLRVSVFEPRSEAGTGRPYGPDLDSALINRPADEMSVRHAEPLDFREWLRMAALRGAAGGADPEARFQPRWLFGHYLRFRLAEAMALLEDRGARVEIHQSAVVDLREQDGGLVVADSQGRTFTCDCAVLCVGTPRPADVHGLAGRSGFIADPYPLTEPLEAGTAVTVLGSNLSAVDLAIALLRRGDLGTIRLMSRNGLLPSVRGVRPSGDAGAISDLECLVRLTPSAELWTAAGRLLRRHLASMQARQDEAARDLSAGEPSIERLRRQLDQTGDVSWRGALLSLIDPVGELLWQRLPITTRQFFLSRINSRIATVLNPMPPETAETLLEALSDGRLEVLSGVTHVAPRSTGGFVVTALDRDYPAELLLNAVRGIPYDDAEPAGQLLSKLAVRGLVRPHPCGGVHIDFQTNRVQGPAPGLFALGHPTAGDIYYANAGSLLGISARAEQIVRQLRALHRRAAPRAGRSGRVLGAQVARPR